MKYLKSYEGFFKNLGGKISDKILNMIDNLPSDSNRIIDADFNNTEKENLETLNFVKNKNSYEFNSNFIDLKIVILKYFDEETPGYASKYYTIDITNNNAHMRKQEKDFDKLLSLVKSIIPEEDLVAKKYNL